MFLVLLYLTLGSYLISFGLTNLRPFPRMQSVWKKEGFLSPMFRYVAASDEFYRCFVLNCFSSVFAVIFLSVFWRAAPFLILTKLFVFVVCFF